jgi:hypothetical protein
MWAAKWLNALYLLFVAEYYFSWLFVLGSLRRPAI